MSAGAPWSVKGIDPKAREVAKDLARRSGMTLGEWLNRVILEDEVPEEVTAEAQFPERPHRAGQALPRLSPAPAPPDLARVAFALDRLTDRIEASETRTGLAITGVEHSVRQALARIETAEREQLAVNTRLERAVEEAADGLRRLESDAGPRSAEALQALEVRLERARPDEMVEDVLQRLGGRLGEAEARTAEALDALKLSLGRLDQRLEAVEHGAGEQAELRFESLAQTLAQQVETLRGEIAEKLQAAAGPHVEARLAQMAQHVQAAERRATRAVEEMGRQVLSMAEAVGRKLSDVDQRGAEAIDQVGSEVARIAGAVELRLARSEQAQAEAFERFGAELARVNQALSEGGPAFGPRLAMEPPEPEPEPEQAFETAVDPQTEALLAEARQRLSAATEPPVDGAAFGPELFSRAETEAEAQPSADVHPATVDAPWRRLDLDVPDADVSEIFAPLVEPDDELFETDAAPSGPELSTREVIERARAAARAAAEEKVGQARRTEAHAKVAASGQMFRGFSVGRARRPQNSALQTALMIAGGAAFLSVGAAGITLMQASPKMQTEAELSPIGPAPRASMALAPTAVTHAETVAPTAAPVFEKVRADVETGAPGALASLKALASAGHAQAQLYLAQLYDGGEAGLPHDPAEARRLTALAAASGDVNAMHNLGVYYFRGEGGPQDLPSAAQWFRKAAAAGVVESQYNLGLLYQSGSGVPKDLIAARHWFRQAAAKGDAEAARALADLTPKPAGPPPAAATRVAPSRSAARRAPPAHPGSAATASAASSMNVRQTQMVLAALGYYAGPADGRVSAAYRSALADYQKDQPTGPHASPGER